MTYKYGIVIYWSEEDQVFIAEIPELPGCVTHGGTPAAALANALEATGLWVDTAKEFGNPVPEPIGRPNVSMPGEAEHTRLEKKQLAATPLRRKNQPRRHYDIASKPVMNPLAR